MSEKLVRVARQKTEFLTPDLWFSALKLIPLSNAITSIFTVYYLTISVWVHVENRGEAIPFFG